MTNLDLFEQFDNEFNSEELKQDLVAVQNGNTERKEVPHDVYEVKVAKLELTKSKSSGSPMVSVWFKIVTGEYKNQLIFMNQVLSGGFGLHKCNEFLSSISKLPVGFESFKQYGLLLSDIMEEIDGKYEFQLNYGTNKGYNTYTIENVFEVQA